MMDGSASRKLKRRSTSSSPGASSATKRGKGSRGEVDENKENSTLPRQVDDEAFASPGSEVGPERLAFDHREEVEGAAEGHASEDEKFGDYVLEDENDDENLSDDNAVSAARGRKKSNAGPGKVAEAGIIKSIYCENFMCHRKLRVDLNRNVNFIYGQNGSGTSNKAPIRFLPTRSLFHTNCAWVIL